MFISIPGNPFVFTVKTSDQENAGTEGSVSVVVCGSKGCTGKLALGPPSSKKFAAGSTEEFEVCQQIWSFLRFHVAHLIETSRDNFSRQIYFFQLLSHMRSAMFNCLCYQARMLKFKCLICSQINVGSIGKIQKLRVIHAEHEDETGWHLNEASLIFMILPYNF